VKYNLFVTFCSVPFFVHTPGAKTRERICTIDHSKYVKSSKDMPFEVSSKNFTPTLNIPQIPKSLHYESRFSRKTRINLGGSAAKIRIRIGNSPWGFQIWG